MTLEAMTQEINSRISQLSTAYNLRLDHSKVADYAELQKILHQAKLLDNARDSIMEVLNSNKGDIDGRENSYQSAQGQRGSL